MSDELKSAWEIALEKLDSQEDMSVRRLSDEQKEEIARVRAKWQARIAEEEIAAQSKLRKAVESGALDEVEKLREQSTAEKARLRREMEKEVEKIHARGSG